MRLSPSIRAPASPQLLRQHPPRVRDHGALAHERRRGLGLDDRSIDLAGTPAANPGRLLRGCDRRPGQWRRCLEPFAASARQRQARFLEQRVLRLPSSQFMPLRFCTGAISESDRLARWREACGRTLMTADVEPQEGELFQCDAVLRKLPGFAFASLRTSAMRMTRTRALVADGNDDLVLLLSRRGTMTVSSHGRDVTLGDGAATLISTAEPSTLVVRAPSQLHCLALPFASLAPLVPDLDSLFAAAVPGDGEAAGLLAAALETLAGEIALSGPELLGLVGRHVCELAALALGARRHAADARHERRGRAVRLQAIKVFIAENAGKPSFSIDEAAARHGVSPRYIRRLFEGSGSTFSKYTLEMRLALARQMLGNARYDGRSIGAVAFDCGFGDLSYFNRTFRDRFGATPSSFRAASQQGST
jgi:AraC-like DNA-binding protein